MIEVVDPAFPTADFLIAALDGYENLELTPRARQVAAALGEHLPGEFPAAARLLEASLGPAIEGDELEGLGMAPFVHLPYVYWVAERGLGHWEEAMRFQHALTQRFSCEFSIRTFIESEPERTLARLREWTADPSPHVRRLVSEGMRPRLPWAPRLRYFVRDPGPVIELLELLKDDPATLVRRSVANNLNDIGKDHPELLVEVCRRWLDGASPERRALVKHALRSAVRRGDAEALALLGFGDASAIAIEQARFEPAVVAIGERVRISLTIMNRARDARRCNVDLRVHFVKATGARSPKVFKLRELELGAGEAAELSKTISVAQQTTRTHHPGEHPVDALVNGRVHVIGSFTLFAP